MAGISNRSTTGIEAEEAIRQFFLTKAFTHGSARQLVRWLDDAGYIVVPKPYTKPARRGNDKKISVDSPWIGKSHSARLVGG
jgi:hypothetical protein